MATYTATTTPEEETALGKMLIKINTQRSAETPPKPALSKNQMVSGIMKNAFKSYVLEEKRETHQRNRAKWDSRTPVQRAQIQTIMDA